MRVIVLADFAAPSGGAQAVAILSAIALAGAGADVVYIHAVDGPADPRLAASGVRVLGLGLRDVWDLPGPQAALAGVWHRRAAARLARALDGLGPGPAILHLHQWTRSASPAILPVLLASRHPLVLTLHDYFLACPNGVYYRFDQDRPCDLVPLSAACLVAPCDPRSRAHKLVRVLRAIATRHVSRRGGFDVVHVSDRGRDTVAPFLPAGIGQHRIDNPVEIERADPVAIAPDARIAFVGRLTREKGADLVAAAAREAGMPALFVGDGPAAAEIRRIDPEAEILGWQPREAVDAVLRTRVRAVAAPSRWYETGPLTVYEALAAGIPAVASRRSGAAEKVADGETGFVVEPDVASLAAAFRALGEPGRAQALGREAHRRYWQAPLDASTHAAALLRLYGGLLARSRN